MTDDPTLLTPQDDLQPGALFAGKYRIQRLLGKGGFGAVYLVKNEEIGWEMALKLLHPEHGADPAYRARFLREMGLARDLLHPNAVPVRDAGVESGRLYYTMDFVPGKSLKDVIQKEGRIAPARAAEWMKQVLSFLTFLHGKHYIHRDLKPDNLIVQDENGVERIRVLDLGIAKSIAASAETMGLTGGSVIGTPHYMAPEHAAGDEVDARIDLYAIGVIFYECCRGARPFHEPTLQKLFHSIRTQEAPPLPKVVEGFSEAMWQVIARALSKDRELRYRDAKAFVAAIDLVLPELTVADGTVVQTAVADSQEPSGPTLKQGGAGAGGARRKAMVAAVAVLLLGAGAVYAMQDWSPPAITSSEPPEGGGVQTSPASVTIYANEALSEETTIAGNRATVVGVEARAEVPFSGDPGKRSIRVELVDKRGNRTLAFLNVHWDPAKAGSGEVAFDIQRQTPLPTEPQKQAFRLEILANRALGPGTTFDGRPASVEGSRASLQIDWLVGSPAGSKEIKVKLVDGAGNPPVEKVARVFWQPDTGAAPQEKPLPPGLVRMAEAHPDPSGYPTLVKHEATDIVLTLFRATGPDGFWRGKLDEKNGRHNPHSPRHRVVIPTPFYLSRTLVSREQYDKASLEKAPNLKEFAPTVPPAPVDPVTGLTWSKASSFCQKLGGRLPTEAEWEWARQEALGKPREFLWDGDANAVKAWANTNESFASQRLAPVSAFPVEALRGKLAVELYDLVGNAAEFCIDGFVPYSDSVENEAAAPIEDPGRATQFAPKSRVIRGASFTDPPSGCYLYRRREDTEFVNAERLNEVGFRLCFQLPK